MKDSEQISKEVDDYIAQFSQDVRAVLQRIRATIRAVAPQAVERISYRMPAFDLNGVFIYFAAFKNHIGIYPPVRGDRRLDGALAPYRNDKGNLAFPLARPIPYALIERVAKARLEEHLQRAPRGRHPIARKKAKLRR